MIVCLCRTIGITLYTVRADYNCVWWLVILYQVLHRTIWIAALPYPCGALVIHITISFCGVRLRVFPVSASVCDSRNWISRSNSFVRAPTSGGGSNAPRLAVSVPHNDVNEDRRQARHSEKRVFLFYFRRYAPEFWWILAYLEFERVNKRPHFQIGVISILASKFLFDDA